MKRAACLAAGLLLAGCAADGPAEPAAPEPGSEFAKPTGASRNPRIGSVGRNPSPTGPQLLYLTRAAGDLSLKKDELVVSRSRDLKATGLFRIVEIHGLAAIATLVRGRPSADDEVVIPSAPLRQQAEALPAAPGS